MELNQSASVRYLHKYLLYAHPLTHTHTVVRIGFEQEVYPAFENVTAMICASLLPDSPSLDREVVVTIRSSDGTATGK